MLTFLYSVLWWIVAGWVAFEAARRQRSWLGWAFLVCATTFIGLLIWLLVRRLSPVTGPALGRKRTVLLGLAGVPIGAVVLVVSSWSVTFVGQVARIEGQAMAPTLENEARVLVNKMAYLTTRPARGEVVMLRYPINPDKLFVKRVVAIAGDRLRIQDGRVFINDVPRLDTEVAPDSRSHDDWGPQVIPEGYCFVMGDRRNNSSDSRHWGMVPEKYVLGRVAYRLTGARRFTAVH